MRVLQLGSFFPPPICNGDYKLLPQTAQCSFLSNVEAVTLSETVRLGLDDSDGRKISLSEKQMVQGFLVSPAHRLHGACSLFGNDCVVNSIIANKRNTTEHTGEQIMNREKHNGKRWL